MTINSLLHNASRDKRVERKRQRTAKQSVGRAHRYKSHTADVDDLFFAEHKSRTYRLRDPMLGDFHDLNLNSPMKAPDGFHYIAVVRQITYGHSVTRIVVGSTSVASVPDGEDFARDLWWMGASWVHLSDRLTQIAADQLRPITANPSPGCAKASQNAKNMLCIRLPLGPHGYPTETAAVEALEAFGAGLGADAPGMGRPLAVGPGDAIWGVWRLGEPVPIRAWREMADVLDQLAQIHGLKHDGPPTNAPPFDLDTLLPGRLEELA